ncbi:MAG: hypothetical protein CMP95_02740 [Gammaproteobacteria bacterium]|nr:hypothetical protein [Gammaproteobacteria bacterium]
MLRLIALCFFALAVSQGTKLQPGQAIADGISSEGDTQATPVLAVITRADPISYGQQIAQSRADYMAARGYRNHPPKSAGNWQSVPGAGFEGVGWRSRNTPHRSVGTCRPSGRSGPHDDNSRVLLGDAVAYSNYGSFRVRIWGK